MIIEHRHGSVQQLYENLALTISDGWLHNVRRRPSPNANERPSGIDISLLVIHNISLPPGEFGGGFVEQLFLNCLDCTIHPWFERLRGLEVSAHVLIERDGSMTQFVPFDRRAWHAGASSYCGRDNCNDYSIGIELEGSDELPYTEAQYGRLAELSTALLKAYPAMTIERIVGHSDIAPGRKSDPGSAFDWQHYRALLGQLQESAARAAGSEY